MQNTGGATERPTNWGVCLLPLAPQAEDPPSSPLSEGGSGFIRSSVLLCTTKGHPQELPSSTWVFLLMFNS